MSLTQRQQELKFEIQIQIAGERMQRCEHRLVARRGRIAAPARVVGIDAGCAREIT